jgi:tetratricopeptide (TPR) repeat protein
LLSLCAALAYAADPAPVSPDDLAKDLGSPNYRTRESATKALWKMGEKARPALEAAAKGTNAEAATRAQSILDKFEWGILPDTPPELMEKITAFRGGVYREQVEVVFDLLKRPEAMPILRALLSKDFAAVPENPGFDSRRAMFEQLNVELRRTVPGLIRAGKFDRAEELLALQTLGQRLQSVEAGHLDYATFVVARGRGKEAIAALEADRKAGKASAAMPLMFLYRAVGDTKKARTILDILATEDPLGFALTHEGFQLETGDWAGLGEQPVQDPNSALGLKAYRLRLAGKTKEANEVLEEAKTAAPGEGGGLRIDENAMALLLNERPDDGIERLKTIRSAPHVLADLLVARLEFQKAMDVIAAGLKEKVEPENPLDDEVVVSAQTKMLYSLKRGRILAQLGKRDAASQVFAALNEDFKSFSSFHVTQAVKAEVRSGFYDLAAELVGRMQAEQEKNDQRNLRGGYGSQEPFEILFDHDADAAKFWWHAMKLKDAKADPGARMREVRDLLVGKLPKEKAEAWLTFAEGITAPDPRSVEGFQRAVGLAAGWRIVQQPKKAIAALAVVADAWTEKSSNDAESWIGNLGTRSWVFGVDEKFRLWVDLGDLLMDQKDYTEAAKRYEQGWKRYPDNPVPLYLAGIATAKAGNADEAKTIREASFLVALGNARTRGRFLEELISRGAPHADLKIARDSARQCTWANEQNSGNVWNQIGRASIILKDYATAVEANRRAIYYVLRTQGVAYVEGTAYLNVPVLLRSLTARQLLAEGKVPEAMEAARAALAIMPTHTEMVLGMVPELDKLKKTKEADELFALVWKPFVKIATDNPESGWARFQAAWVAAGCRRELPKALEYAKKAVETEPTNRSFRECLAEVQFRMGERDPAVKLATALVAEEPRNWHYQRQLERYKSAAFDSPLPDSEDD